MKFARPLAIAIVALTIPAGAQDGLRVEIQRHAGAPSSVMVRVVNGDPEALYWIQRSNDGGRTWEDEARVTSGAWWFVSDKPSAALFRAGKVQ
jgi:hypothetical protein